jgi:hypothetical protein
LSPADYWSIESANDPVRQGIARHLEMNDSRKKASMTIDGFPKRIAAAVLHASHTRCEDVRIVDKTVVADAASWRPPRTVDKPVPLYLHYRIFLQSVPAHTSLAHSRSLQQLRTHDAFEVQLENLEKTMDLKRETPEFIDAVTILRDQLNETLRLGVHLQSTATQFRDHSRVLDLLRSMSLELWTLNGQIERRAAAFRDKRTLCIKAEPFLKSNEDGSLESLLNHFCRYAKHTSNRLVAARRWNDAERPWRYSIELCLWRT